MALRRFFADVAAGTCRRCGLSRRSSASARPRLSCREAHAEAQRLDESWIGWTVLYGTGSRRFYAVAAWSVPEPLVVEARTTVELAALMCEEEMAMIARREVIVPSQDRRRLP